MRLLVLAWSLVLINQFGYARLNEDSRLASGSEQRKLDSNDDASDVVDKKSKEEVLPPKSADFGDRSVPALLADSSDASGKNDKSADRSVAAASESTENHRSRHNDDNRKWGRPAWSGGDSKSNEHDLIKHASDESWPHKRHSFERWTRPTSPSSSTTPSTTTPRSTTKRVSTTRKSRHYASFSDDLDATPRSPEPPAAHQSSEEDCEPETETTTARPSKGRPRRTRDSRQHEREAQKGKPSAEQVVQIHLKAKTKRLPCRGGHPATGIHKECGTAPPGYASFFVGRDILLDRSKGTIRPLRQPGCGPCAAGTQYAYKAINPEFDIGDIPTTNNLVIGTFYCKNPSDLCVETTDGKRFRGQPNQQIAIQPTPFCQHGRCKVYMVVRSPDPSTVATNAIALEGSTLTITQADQMLTVGNPPAVDHYLRFNFDQFPYLSIAGVACNRCEPANFGLCNRAIFFRQNRV